MSKRKRLLGALVTGALTAVIVPGTGAVAQKAASRGLAPGTYQVTYSASITGSVAFAGVPLANAVNLAASEINKSQMLGRGVRIKINQQDDGGAPDRAIAIANQTIADKNNLAMMCCALSGVTGAVKPIFLNGDLPLVITSAVLPKAEQPPLIYRTAILQGLPGGPNDQLAEAAAAAFKPKTAVIAIAADNEGVKAEGANWKAAFERSGVQVLKVVDTLTTDTDFSGPATQIIDLKPDIFVGSMLGLQETLLIKALRERGYKGKILGNLAVQSKDLYKTAAGALDGVIFPIAFSPLQTDAAAQKFVAAYKARFKGDPDVFAAQGYTATYFVAEALKKAAAMTKNGKPTRADMAKALGQVTTMDTVYGKMIVENGQARTAKTTFLEWMPGGDFRVWKP